MLKLLASLIYAAPIPNSYTATLLLIPIRGAMPIPRSANEPITYFAISHTSLLPIPLHIAIKNAIPMSKGSKSTQERT